jgi:hypothetical protein
VDGIIMLVVWWAISGMRPSINAIARWICREINILEVWLAIKTTQRSTTAIELVLLAVIIYIGGLVVINIYPSSLCFSASQVNAIMLLEVWWEADMILFDFILLGHRDIRTNYKLWGEGRSTQQMTYPYDADTYVDWDFANIWAIDSDHSINDGYPYLRQMPVSTHDNIISGSSFSQVPTLRNYPNPFNPETTICFYLPQNTREVDLRIYNLRGQLVRTLIKSTAYPRGESSIVWNGRDDLGRAVSSGTFFYHLITPQRCTTGRMTLLK